MRFVQYKSVSPQRDSLGITTMDSNKRCIPKEEAIETDFPLYHRHSIVHFRQRFDWDCGIACVMMMLTRTQRQQFLRRFVEISTEEDYGKSTWTIDLCYLLHRFGVRNIYATITIGVNPEYQNHDYYESIFWRDSVRVNKKFASATDDGLVIQKKSVDNQAIIEHIALHGPVIVLTNGYLLHCDVCQSEHSDFLNDFRKCFAITKPVCDKMKFSGHYIVICGYDNSIGRVFYRNPALNDHICVMSFEQLTGARTTDGTDEDLIFVFRETNH